MNDKKDLEALLNASYPIVMIETHEEEQALGLLAKIAAMSMRDIYVWTILEGLRPFGETAVFGDTPPSPGEALVKISDHPARSITVLLDFHPYLEEPLNIRLLKERALEVEETERIIVMISHRVELPQEIKTFAARFSLSLPKEEDIKRMVREVVEEWTKKTGKVNVRTSREVLEKLFCSLKGLTEGDVKRLVRGAIFDDGVICEEDLEEIRKIKYELLCDDKALSFEFDVKNFSDVAGLEDLKHWLKIRQKVFRGEVKKKGLDQPKGILLLGVQGCGKSLAAKAVAGAWHVPLLRFDFGAVFNKYIGETERNFREALSSAEALAPCVLWLDEVEKGLSSSGEDNGTSQRILGTLLTWMAERSSPVFMVATANDISTLPPELLRKGRFDEIFFVDLPNQAVREEIFKIHLLRREQDIEKLDLLQLAADCDGFSGAEIEQIVVSGLYSALALEESLSQEILSQEIKRTRPLSVVMKEKIDDLRSWAEQRTVSAG